MQASKVVIGQVYAVKNREGGVLLRFTPTEVTTTRKSNHNNPHDYISTVTGWLENIVTGQPNEKVEIDPKRIEGEFAQFAELVARKKAEDKAREEKKRREEAAAVELATLFYKLAGQELPDDMGSHRSPFRAQWTRVEVSTEGVALLLAHLKG